MDIFLMLEICVYLIEFAIIFIVLIAVISILITPCIYFILYIVDIIFGNSYFKLIRSRRFKNIIGYIGNHCKLNRFSRLFNKFPHHEKDIYLRYNTPAYSFCFSSFNVCILMELFPSKYSELEAFIWSNIIYVLCYYIGMYRKLYDKANDKKFMAAIETNQEFLKLSFIPITFAITIIGFALGVMGWVNEFEGFSVSIYKTYDIINLFFRGKTYGTSFGSVLYSISEILLLMYVVSLPLQAIGYFGIQVILYIKKYGAPYFILVKKIVKSIKTSI